MIEWFVRAYLRFIWYNRDMNKIKAKVFTIFWLASGAVWAVSGVKYIINKEDTIVIVIYIATAIASFGLAFRSYRRK